MNDAIKEHLRRTLKGIRDDGLYKAERVITSPQDAHIHVGEGELVLNMCANNYLGLAEHPEVIAAAHADSARASDYLHSRSRARSAETLPFAQAIAPD